MTNKSESKTGDFKTLWIQYDKSCTDRHQLFFKQHSRRNQSADLPRGQTLFLLNVPPYATESSLKNIFEDKCGSVRSVSFAENEQEGGFKTTFVVFERESGLEKALALPSTSCLYLNSENNPCLTGISKWCKEYNDSIKCEKTLKMEIEEYMQSYDERIAEKKLEKNSEGAEEDDGWVVATSRKKRGQQALPNKQSTMSNVREREEKKNKKKELLNFYTFQIRESKRKDLVELRKKFEIDKQKLQRLKTHRKFRPF